MMDKINESVFGERSNIVHGSDLFWQVDPYIKLDSSKLVSNKLF